MTRKYVAKSFAMIGARSSRHIVAFCLTASQLARSWASSQTFNPPPILTRHRSNAESRVVGIETSRTESFIEEGAYSRVGQYSHVLPTHPRKAYQLQRWPTVAPSLNVCTRKSQTYTYIYVCVVLQSRSMMTEKKGIAVRTQQQYCCNSPQVVGTHWIHTLGHLEIDEPPINS